MSADPDAVPYIEPADTPVRVLLKPFTADDLYHAVRDTITRATDLAAIAEAEIVRAHAGLSKLAVALEASRMMRVQTLDLVVAARELRRACAARLMVKRNLCLQFNTGPLQATRAVSALGSGHITGAGVRMSTVGRSGGDCGTSGQAGEGVDG
jgi:hypothetical protein